MFKSTYPCIWCVCKRQQRVWQRKDYGQWLPFGVSLEGRDYSLLFCSQEYSL